MPSSRASLIACPVLLLELGLGGDGGVGPGHKGGAERLPLVDHVPGDPRGDLALLLDAGLGRRQVIVDDAAGVLDHPLEILPVVLAVPIDVDLADQGEPHRLLGRPGRRVDDVAHPDRIDRAVDPVDPAHAVLVAHLDQLDRSPSASRWERRASWRRRPSSSSGGGHPGGD